MKSFCVMRVPDNVHVLGHHKLNARMVYCFNDNMCIHSRLLNTYEEADAFGLEYLDTDWDLYGFPDSSYRVSQNYLDSAKKIV